MLKLDCMKGLKMVYKTLGKVKLKNNVQSTIKYSKLFLEPLFGCRNKDTEIAEGLIISHTGDQQKKYVD